MAKVKVRKSDIRKVTPLDLETDEEIIAKMPDTTKVRNHLIAKGSLTSAEAWHNYGISRLAAVIYKLRHKKEPIMDIKTRMVYSRDKYGQPVQYGVYYI